MKLLDNLPFSWYTISTMEPQPMAKYKVYMSQFTSVTVEADSYEEAEKKALQAYWDGEANIGELMVEDYDILPPEAA